MLSGAKSIGENIKDAQVGTLTGLDENQGDTFRFAFDNTVAHQANARFQITSDGKLVLKAGTSLDYEAADLQTDAGGKYYLVAVKATDNHDAVQGTATPFKIYVRDDASDNAPVVAVPHTVSGAAKADRLTGGAESDYIFGLGGNDRLSGAGGADRLHGGSGNDTLTGGVGPDAFVFDTRPDKRRNLDKIVDFNVADDTIRLDHTVFRKLGKTGSDAAPANLAKAFFTIGDKAKDKNDYLIYDRRTGVLSYDKDGSGAGEAVAIAKMQKNLRLTDKDFLIV